MNVHCIEQSWNYILLETVEGNRDAEKDIFSIDDRQGCKDFIMFSSLSFHII